MKRRLLALCASLFLASTIVSGADAQTVYDPWTYSATMNVFATQQNALRQQIQQYLTQAQQLQNEISQLAALQQQLKQLPTQYMNQLAADLTRLETLMQNEHQLALKAANMDPWFKSIYQPYTPPQNMPALYQTWDQNTHDAAEDALAAAQAILTPSEAPSTTYSNNVAAVKTATGQTAAIQATGTIAAQQVEQLQKLQQLEAYRTSFEVQYYLQATSVQTAQRQREDAVLKWINANAITATPASTAAP
jgi:P-type conjugative transfer protein TrbJ